MSTTTTMTFTSAKAKSAALIASTDTSLKTASTPITKVEKKLPKIDAAVTKLHTGVNNIQDSQNNLKATIEFPEMVTAAADLQQTLSKIRVLEFRIKQETEEKARYQKKFNEVSLEALRAKKENKSLIKTVAEQSLEIDNIRSEVREYFKASEEGYNRRVVSSEAYAAELEELLDVQRNDKYAQADKIQCVSTSALWSN